MKWKVKMNTQSEGYKATAFQARNLVFYFLIVFGLQAIHYGLLITLGVHNNPFMSPHPGG